MKNAPVKAKITSENIHISRKMLYLCARKEPIELFCANMDIIQTIDSVDKSATVYLNNDMGSIADNTFWTFRRA